MAVIDVWPALTRPNATPTPTPPVPDAMPTTTSAAFMLIHMLRQRSHTVVLIQPDDVARRDLLIEAGATDVIIRSEDVPLRDQIRETPLRLRVAPG